MPLAEPYTEANDTITKDRTPQGNDGTVSGATIKYDGLVNAGAGLAYINQDKAYGTWEFDIYNYDTSVVKIISNGFVSGSVQGYDIVIGSTGYVKLRILNDGALELFNTGTSYISANTDYRIKITRSLAGVFTAYIKGGTFGWDSWTTVSVAGGSGSNPVTDNTYTTSNYLVADLDDTDSVSNLRIDGKRISLANAVQSTGTWTTTAGSYDFDGTDDYISIADADVFSFGDSTDDSAFSISTWVNMADATNFMIASKGVKNTDGEWRLEINVNDYMIMYLYDESVDDCFVGRYYTTTLDENVWLHLVATYDGRGGADAEDGINLYLNGNVVDNGDSKGGIYVAMENLAHDVWIGRYSTIYAEGQISNLKIHNRELSSTDVAYQYNKEKNNYGAC